MSHRSPIRFNSLHVALGAILLGIAACSGGEGGGTQVLWSADAEAIENPFPSDRLLSGGMARAPVGYFARVLPDEADFATARAFLEDGAGRLATTGGYSVYAPVVVPLSGEIDAAALTGVHLYPEAGGANAEVTLRWSEPLGALLVTPVKPLRQKTRYVLAIADDALAASDEFASAMSMPDSVAQGAVARGVAASADELDVVVAFTTQPVADDLQAIQTAIDGPMGDALLPSFAPTSILDFPIGVFSATNGEIAPIFAPFTANTANIAVLAQGTWSAKEFRGADDLFDPARIAGAATLTTNLVDFRLMIPDGTPPAAGWPVVIVSHGVTGDSREGLQRAYSFAAAGIATISLTATNHGYRGSPLDFFDFTRTLEVRDELRQSDAEILQLERLLRNAKTADIAPFDRLDAERVTYFGNSFGGLLGGGVAATSTHLDAVGFTVTGGRLPVLLDGTAGDLLLQLFLGQVGLAAHADFHDDYVEAFRIVAQWALDPADGGALAPYAPAGRPVLLQEAVGDVTILHESTESLRVAWDAPVVDAPANPFGGRGLWYWDVADFPDHPGTVPHDMYWRIPAMRHQMEQFLLSSGTVLVAE